MPVRGERNSDHRIARRATPCSHGLVATTIFSVAGLMVGQNRMPKSLIHGVLIAFTTVHRSVGAVDLLRLDD
ncbi:hypothetical protein AGR4A_pAt10488 [Agrobacterium tumefaciens str. B6]|uniref:Uncharacterized protein n=1 Tax=Agrobacterium tumefaciens str. B6 TaxID=1183423 RepID=A0A822VCH2_AGRTU|nr:hypothetical protein AGR4A_pAt10488 [Agrobacterium tumefaciens str. B6]